MNKILLAFLVASFVSCSTAPKQLIDERQAIEIASRALTPNPDWKYTVSATQDKSGEWLVLFEGSSDLVGDFVFVHVDKYGKVRRKDGGM